MAHFDPTNPLSADVPMPIETSRLILRPLMPGDGAQVSAAKRETEDQLRPWMIWMKDGVDEQQDEDMCRNAYADFLLRRDFNILGCRKEDGLPVVFTGLHRFDWAKRRFEIGYWVRAGAQNRRYAGEAANALARYAFGVFSARAVVIKCAEGNAASLAVAERLGFSVEGIAKSDSLLPDGRVVDTHVFSITSTAPLPPLDVRWGSG